MTVLPWPMTVPNVSTIDLRPVVLFGPIATELMGTDEPFDRTVKLEASGNEVVCNFSLNVTVMLSPLDATDPVEYTGPVWSTVELFVPKVIALKESASLPATSWIALLAVVASVLGAA